MTRGSPGSTLIVWGIALSGALVWVGGVAAAGQPLGSPWVAQMPGAVQAGPPPTTSPIPSRGTPASPASPSQTTAAVRPGPCGPWWKDEAFTKDIGLRPNQSAEIDRIYNRRLRDMDPFIKDYGQQRSDLDKMIADRVVDSNLVDRQATSVNNLWSRLNSSQVVMLYRMSKALDLDQYAKLRARSAGASCGPPNSGRNEEWWKDEAIKKEIGLSSDQAARIDDFYSRRLKDMDPFIQAYGQQRAVLDKMLADRVADDTQVDVLVTNVNALRSRLRSSRTLMLYKISKVLNADQYAKLKVIFERQLAARRGGRGGSPAPVPAPRALPR